MVETIAATIKARAEGILPCEKPRFALREGLRLAIVGCLTCFNCFWAGGDGDGGKGRGARTGLSGCSNRGLAWAGGSAGCIGEGKGAVGNGLGKGDCTLPACSKAVAKAET